MVYVDVWRYFMAALQWAEVYDMTMMAFGQCRHVNSTMMSVFPLRLTVIGYWTDTVFIFALYSALYFFGDYIARTATVQKGV